MDTQGRFWLTLWGTLGVLVSIIIIGTYSGYLDDKHDQQMADKGYSKIKTLSCKEYTITTDYKLNITEGDK